MRPAPLRVSFYEPVPSGGGASGGEKRRVLIVDDDGAMLAALGLFFERRGFHAVVAASLGTAKSLARKWPGWTLVVSDYHLPDGSGLELEAWLRAQPFAPAPQFLLMSGSGGPELPFAGVEFLAKPFTMQDLNARVDALLLAPRPNPLARQ